MRAMARWPDVPAVYGWLALDRRGEWLIRGSRVTNPALAAYIGRNYARDERGCWFFQNGPQRVFVSLEYTPFVYRVATPEGARLELECHTGQRVARIAGAWIDETGALLLATERGIGLLHDRDLARVLPCILDENGERPEEAALEALLDLAQSGEPVPLWLGLAEARVKLEPIRSAEVPHRFGFVPDPAPPGSAEH